MTPDYAESLSFLKWYAPNGLWVLTAIETDRKGIETKTFGPENEAALTEWLEKQGTTRNIYFHVNPTLGPVSKKAERADISRLAWLHVDVDPRAGEDLKAEQERALRKLTDELPEGVPRPNCVVFSGGGYQGFWRLSDGMDINGDESLYEDAKRYNLQLEILFGADNCHNVDRIMRLPGTLNRPDAKKKRKGRQVALATIVYQDHGSYPLSQFFKAPQVQAPGVTQSSRRVEISGNIKRLASVDELPDTVPDLCKVVIVQGYDPDEPKRFPSRSEALMYVCCELVRQGVTDDVVYSIVTDPDFKISESVLDKKSSAEKYALRQIERAHDIAIDPDLGELNQKYAVISSIGGRCRIIYEEFDYALHRPRIVRQSFEDFRNSLMNRKKVIGQNKDGIDIKKSLGHWWLEHESRRQFETITFSPGQETPGVYNLWQGFGCEARPGDCTLFMDHVRENLCAEDTELFEYLLGWMANAVQKPGQPGHAAIVLRGRQGTGKSFFAKHMGVLFGRHFLQVSNPSHLVGNFNAHLRDCVLLFGDEAFYAGDKRHESVLKTLVTEDLITIEAKGIDAESSKNCVHLIMASNDAWVVPAGLDDRRFLVLDVTDAHQKDTEYFGAIEDQLRAGGYEALLHLLLTYDLTGFDVRMVPRTAALQQQKMFSMSTEEEWWFAKLQDGRILTQHGEWAKDLVKQDLQNDFAAYTARFGTVRRGNATKLGQFLTRVCPSLKIEQRSRPIQSRNVDGEPITVNRPYYYIFPSLKECRRVWDDRFGGPYDWPQVKQVEDGGSMGEEAF